MISFKALCYLEVNNQHTHGTCVQASVIFYLAYYAISSNIYTKLIHIHILDKSQLKLYRNRFHGGHILFLCIKECRDVKLYCRIEFLRPKNN